MKIYLDNCCLQRPLDDKSQLRIQLEAEAILAVLTFCEEQEVQLVSSDVLEFEKDKNPHPQRKAYVEEILANAPVFVELNDKIVQRGKELEQVGFKGADALHIACAESEQVDYFCSCDERLLRRAKTLKVIRVKVVSPLELVEEIIE
jgi:predicted nucleic acid-binding protein